MKIVLTTQPAINTIPNKSLLAAKQPPESPQEPIQTQQKPFTSAPQPGQIEKVITLFHQPNDRERVISAPLTEYQAIEAIESRLILETLVGVDIYV